MYLLDFNGDCLSYISYSYGDLNTEFDKEKYFAQEIHDLQYFCKTSLLNWSVNVTV